MSGKRQMVVVNTTRVTTSRGPEEPQIDQGAAPTMPTQLQTRKTSLNALMASTFALTERPLVLLLILPLICIIFNYGVLKNSYKPSVATFKILDRPTFSTIRFQRPGLEKERTTHGAKFPSQTDLQKNQDTRENIKH
ncbi:hypothetical protein K469DRAFT_699342 [Zopfia rhizophila CBS 207.26]|uniref:Uncharacterized protein n=1 Tax=Zopfia rhizophila CBS 207.26 TaxID=1314779 RepID=A0A6A6EW05_9PEZI|nr:hypothetical protein K469DRAFT_699342 [Zopfia rhizophila CBS 207.26]